MGQMSALEFAEWMAYYSLEPFGERRADYRSAQIVQMIANVNRTRGEPYPLSDFLPDEIAAEAEELEDEPEENWQAQIRVAEMITAAYGGKDMRQQ
jgi:hypothetical protein